MSGEYIDWTWQPRKNTVIMCSECSMDKFVGDMKMRGGMEEVVVA